MCHHRRIQLILQLEVYRTLDRWPQEINCFLITAPTAATLPSAEENQENQDLTKRFSRLGDLIRTIARCLRLKHLLTPGGRDSLKASLTADEHNRAYLAVIRYVQQRHFQEEIHALRRGNSVGIRSCIRKLDPFMDSEGTLRVGGRLHNAELSYDQHHQAIIPKKCHLARLIIDRAHRAMMHGGQALTYVCAIRTTWFIGGRALTRAFVRNCVTCTKARARPSGQMMGNLPTARVTPSRLFARTGLDYAGPFSLKAAKGRGDLTTKSFICLSTKAVHLEIVGDLTTASFLADLRRF